MIVSSFLYSQIMYDQTDYKVAWNPPQFPIGTVTYDIGLIEFDIINLNTIGETIVIKSAISVLEYSFDLKVLDMMNKYYAINVRANDRYNSLDHISEWASSIVEKDCDNEITFVIFYDFSVGKVKKLKLK